MKYFKRTVFIIGLLIFASVLVKIVYDAEFLRSGAEVLKVAVGSTVPKDLVRGDISLTGTSRYLMSGGVYVPAAGAVDFRALTTGSTATGATKEGLRRATWQFFDTKTDDVSNALIMMDVIQRTNPSNQLIGKTGIHVKMYSQPDNGGDSSGGLFVQTGGGNALTAYKASSLRPTGFTDYANSVLGGYAFEAGTSDGFYAVGVFAGGRGTTNTGGGVLVNLMNSTAKGILINPNNGIFDGRIAYAIGQPAINASDGSVTFKVDLAGNLSAKSGVFASTLTSSQFRLSALNTAPASATATGTLGEIRIVNGFIYVAVGTNVWQRAALTTW